MRGNLFDHNSCQTTHYKAVAFSHLCIKYISHSFARSLALALSFYLDVNILHLSVVVVSTCELEPLRRRTEWVADISPGCCCCCALVCLAYACAVLENDFRTGWLGICVHTYFISWEIEILIYKRVLTIISIDL